MKKKATRITGIRFSEATYKAVVQTAKSRDYASPSAFIRAAVEKELRGADATLDESEQRISASLEVLEAGPSSQHGAAGSLRLYGCVSQSDSQHAARYGRGYEESRRRERKAPLLPIPQERWSKYGGRRPGGAYGTGESCPGRMTTTIRNFGCGQGSLRSRESDGQLPRYPLPFGRS